MTTLPQLGVCIETESNNDKIQYTQNNKSKIYNYRSIYKLDENDIGTIVSKNKIINH